VRKWDYNVNGERVNGEEGRGRRKRSGLTRRIRTLVGS